MIRLIKVTKLDLVRCNAQAFLVLDFCESQPNQPYNDYAHNGIIQRFVNIL